jgi:glyoxylase-like metal-dependent hydrolase (beta-lactamase superfamily II)
MNAVNPGGGGAVSILVRSPRRALGLAGVVFLTLAVTIGTTASGRAQPQTVADLVRVADDVYMFRMTGYNAMFIVTDQGVIATDPIGPARAPLYKAAIAAVTDQPVRYVIYGHDHADHSSGGSVFAETAEFVSHWLAVPRVAARGDPTMPVPTIIFEDHMSLELGGKIVELYYVGLNHSDNNILVVYPAQRVAFGVDFIEHERVFSRSLGGWLNDWLDGFRWIEENLEFDVLVSGHGELGSKDTFRQQREYMQDLMEAVRAARAAGHPDNSDAMVSFVRDRLMPRYGRWTDFESRISGNVGGVVRYWESN